MGKLRCILVLLAVLFAGVACNKDILPAGTVSGECSAVFRLTSRDAVTLRTRSNATDLLDGLRFTNVLVILVDRSGNVVGNVYRAYTDTSMTEDVIHFDHLNPGNYTAYAYANIDAEAWQKSGEEISASGQEKFKNSGSFSAFLERELKAANPVTPTIASETSMLLTGQADVPVGLSVEPHDVYLKRPVVRFRVYINNTTPYPVRVDQLGFSEFNADRAYLLGRSDENGVPVTPSGVTYGPLPSYPILSGSLSTAPQAGAVGYQEEYLIYETLLYENACPEPYEIFALLTLDPSDLNMHATLGGRRMAPVDAGTINGMAVGDTLDVLVTNPRKQTRSARLYYGVSAEDNYAWESCGYDNYTNLLNRVDEILNESSSHFYSGFSYTGCGSSQSGLAGWTGLAADAPLGPAPNGPTVTFNYTGANSGHPKKYFRTLRKNSDGFSIEGLSTTSTSLTGMTVVQGSTSDFTRFASNLPVDKLVKFVKNSKRLKSDCMYNESNVNNAKKTKLVWDNGDNQDHLFMLFRETHVLAPLKRILKDSHKEVPLTYMTRNEDIKLVINVFYADQEATVNFEVDNSTWMVPAQSSHSFN